jgi:hypothetical protein
MSERSVAPRPYGSSRRALRIKRTVAGLVVLAAAAVGVDYGAAAVTESVVAKQMRTQLGLADDPSVRINNFPFLVQAISGTYKSVDVVTDHLAIGPFRDVQVRSQLRDVRAPLSQMLGDGPHTVTVREVEGTARISAVDVERLIRSASGVPIDKVYIDRIDSDGLEKAVEDGADPSLLSLDPANAVRMGGDVDVLGETQQVALIAELQLADGRIQLTPRDVRLGDADATPLPPVVQRTVSRLFTLTLDPGSLPLQITPTALRAQSGALEISGLTGRLVLGAGAPTG